MSERTFTFGHEFCPQCGVDVDPEEEGKDQYCEACEDLFKGYQEQLETVIAAEGFIAPSEAAIKAEADAMADWEAARYGY